MTDQEVFDIVADHLTKQGKKSMGSHRCMYRGLEDTKCAIGCLITNDEYMFKLEGHVVGEHPINELLTNKGVSLDLARKLQTVHDNNDVCDWPFALKAVAVEYGLAYSGYVPPLCTA